MAQFIPGNNDWAQAFQQFGSGLSQGYMNRSDENAVRKAITDLGPNASARDILQALTGAKTYGQESKQMALKNYLGVEQFEELKRKGKEQQQIRDLDLKKQQEKNDLEKGSTSALIENSALDSEKKEQLKKQIDEGLISYQAAKDILSVDKGSDKQKEKENAAQTGLKTIARMRELGTKGNLGRGSNFYRVFGGETAKDAGEYEQLGKSLIQLSTNIPIRNRQEFETLAHNLYNSSLPDSEREGILNALESIIKGNLGSENKDSRPPLSSFMR